MEEREIRFSEDPIQVPVDLSKIELVNRPTEEISVSRKKEADKQQEQS